MCAAQVDREFAPVRHTLEAMSCAFWRHGYALFFKVPCDGGGVWRAPAASHSHRTAYMPISGRYHAMLPPEWALPNSVSAPCALGGQHCDIQDVLVLDLRSTELRALVHLGNRECGTDFPADVVPSWAEPVPDTQLRRAPLLPLRTRLEPQALIGESERGRGGAWMDTRPANGTFAVRRADGTWSCRLAAEPRRDNESTPPPTPIRPTATATPRCRF